MSGEQQVWLVTAPVRGEIEHGDYFSSVKHKIKDDGCALARVIIPDLAVGTLDSLIRLSDDIVKSSTQVDNILKKIERIYLDTIAGHNKITIEHGNKNKLATLDVAQKLKVKEQNISEFIKSFAWDYARYPINRPLDALISDIQHIGSKVDDELKKLSVAYNERNNAHSASVRRRNTNFYTSDFEDIFMPKEVANIEFLDTEYLRTLVIVVPKSIESDFLNAYSTTICHDIASYGDANNRGAIKGSPIVPDSAIKLKEDNDAIIYTITSLKGHSNTDSTGNNQYFDYIEPIKSCFRERRMIIREFIYDSSKAGGLEKEIKKCTTSLLDCSATIIQYCTLHYSDIYSSIIHLKLIQAYIESVLRYSLPVDLMSFFVIPDMNKAINVQKLLTNIIINSNPEILHKRFHTPNELGDAEDEDENSAFPNLPYVLLKFNI